MMIKGNIIKMVRELSPAYFAMVMATGIISNVSFLLDLKAVAYPLFWINSLFYIVLCLVTIFRFLWFRKEMAEDLFDHVKGMGFFTFIAATGILGVQFILLTGNYQIAKYFWGVAIVFWVFITFTIFSNITIKNEKPLFSEGINGSWLLAVVSTQSLSILSALLSLQFIEYKLILNFFALSMWLWGGMLYIWMISLIFYRYTFFKFQPGDLTPPYWINMGAMAISTLAGSILIANTADAPFLLSTLSFLKGFTIFYWATGTWWIPMLFILAIWRHVYKRFPLKYDSLYWGAVFPLGMYAACTFEMAKVMEFDFLLPIVNVFLYLSLLAWIITFFGFLISTFKKLSPASSVQKVKVKNI